jgi:hypothetical protein
VTYSIQNALFQWEEGESRLSGREDDRAVRFVVEELRRRLGGRFTLAELAEFYGEGTDWLTDELLRRFTGTDISAAVNAGFLRYAGSASDYAGGRLRLPDEERAV